MVFYDMTMHFLFIQPLLVMTPNRKESCFHSKLPSLKYTFNFFFVKQKLLEEIEQNKDKVDECQKYAKAYIDTIKVSLRQHWHAYILNLL